MNLLITMFCLLCTNFCFAQQNNVYVEYSVKIDDEKQLFSNNQTLRVLFDRAISESSNLVFGLIITKTASKFFDNSGITSVGNNFVPSTMAFAGYNGIVYTIRNQIFRESRSLDKNMLIKEKSKEDWQFYNETKLIDNYLCYKATSINKVDNGAGKIFNHPVTAWYCPELPYSFGPNGYSNLPGLILEIQVRNVVYGIKKIDLNSTLDFDSKFLNSVKTITVEELNQKLQQNAENFK